MTTLISDTPDAVRALIARVLRRRFAVADEQDLARDLQLCVLTRYTLRRQLEAIFRVKITADEAQKWVTVRDVIEGTQAAVEARRQAVANAAAEAVREIFLRRRSTPRPPLSLDTTRPVRTRNGLCARLVATNLSGSRPIAAVITGHTGERFIEHFSASGQVVRGQQSSLDLVNVA